MSHLPTERLAALVDEPPTSAELAHLAGCAECAREREVFQRLVEAAASEPARIGAPLSSWEKLAPALVADGIVEKGNHPVAYRTWASGRSWRLAAAGLLLAAGGAIGGRLSAGAAVFPVPAVQARPDSSSAVARLVSDSTPHFASIEEARAAQLRSQLVYQTATAFLAQRDTAGQATDSPAAIRTRLAALDRAHEVMGEALNEAPYDPVINGYYLNTLGQREATIQQLNAVLPASMRVTSY
ncbi:MAG TPA: hypothetical protein VHB25_09215 [Gemmatimonadaceae bacterium]|nr:hypothetical protein [Gemmatimonadaceae bacterium]